MVTVLSGSASNASLYLISSAGLGIWQHIGPVQHTGARLLYPTSLGEVCTFYWQPVLFSTCQA
jgi:hypothetical protein